MQKKTTVTIISTVILLFITVLFLAPPEPAEAIPAFARKYRMSCTTCHAPIPRLKAYGDDFAGNGFVLKDQDAPRYFVDAGDQRLSLIREFPVAARLEGFIKHDSRTNRETDFTAPYNLKFLSGGALAKNVSYYFYFFFSERGEVAGIEDAFIMFNNLFKQDLDVYVGQFQVCDPLFKRELRLTYEDYQVYRESVGNSGINLTYDRGFMVTYGLPTNTSFVLEVLNGNGIGKADDFRVYDNDKYKNVAGRVSQDIGDFLRIGGFGYYGKEVDTTTYKNRVWMAGPDMTLSWMDKLELNLQYLERRDDNPFFDATKPPEVESRGGLAELIILPWGERSTWYGTVLYNKYESDIPGNDYETITGHIGYLLRTNIRLILENTYDIEHEENRVVIGFVSAF